MCSLGGPEGSRKESAKQDPLPDRGWPSLWAMAFPATCSRCTSALGDSLIGGGGGDAASAVLPLPGVSPIVATVATVDRPLSCVQDIIYVIQGYCVCVRECVRVRAKAGIPNHAQTARFNSPINLLALQTTSSLVQALQVGRLNYYICTACRQHTTAPALRSSHIATRHTLHTHVPYLCVCVRVCVRVPSRAI